MTNNNSTQLSFLQKSIDTIKEIFNQIWSLLSGFSDVIDEYFPNMNQNIQLTFIYLFAMLDLFNSIFTAMVTMGYLPGFMEPYYPFIKSLITNPIIRILTAPERIFFFSFLVLELMVNRPNKFSKLVKYNVLLIFTVLMIQGLAITYWDFLFNRAIASPVLKYSYDQGIIVNMDRQLANTFFYFTFMAFFLGYIYFYFRALSGKFIRIIGLEWLTDSVAFWLRIKTPTMRIAKGYGKRRRKGPKKK